MAATDFETQVAELIARGQWNALRQGCETAELASANDSAAKPHYSLQLFSYLLLNDLDSARFLWKRLPAKVKKESQEINAIWSVGKGMWKNKYEEVYQALLSSNWDANLKPLAEALLASFRNKTAILVARSYSNITEQTASHLLGMTAVDAVAHCKNHLGWGYDEATKLLTPKLPEKPEVQTLGADQLHTLTSYVVALERK